MREGHASGLWVGAALLSLAQLATAQQQPAPGIPVPTLSQPSYTFDTGEQHQLRVQVLARGLNHPFAVALLPDGDALISERGGALRLLRNATGAAGRPTQLEAAPVPGLPTLEKTYRNAGLHDLALHPGYAQNHWVYFSFNKPGDTVPGAGNAPARQLSKLTVMRATFDGRALTDAKEIFVGKSGGTSGSRIAFDGDGLLYIINGAAVGDDAQRMDNTVGKVLRVKDDGSIPADNPYVGQKDVNPAVFTRGHRDPLALTWHRGAGVMLAGEHGPNGGDELNLIRGGKNYGWPVVTYGHGYDGAVLSESPVAAGIEPPLVYWVPSIGPSGLTVYTGDRFPAWKNNVFIGSVRRGEIPGTGGLERVVLNDKLQELRRETLLTELHQRIRDVRQGADGLLYVLTDEADGALLRLEPASR
ncbi:MAG TPA: PQQ-dependent sugar dehydrogenase [Steroidobacteraceae bacterium]|nr:PQQ-dependent sugar dehydrogenase [Steroidobacteraceae bacterium]